METTQFKNFHFFLIFLSLLAVSYLLYIDLLEYEWRELDYNLRPKKWSRNDSFKVLENILTAKVQPEDGRNIFFIDSTRMRHKRHRPFKVRQACAVESAALMNPHLNVFVSTVTSFGDNILAINPAIEAILSYQNVNLNFINLVEFTKQTPLEDFIRSQKLQNAKFVVAHTSDVLRYLILWKFGGTYLDTDMIVKQKLDSVELNYACDDTDDVINGAILNLDRDRGKVVAEKLINDLVKSYNGSDWGSNGPMLVTRILQQICQTNISAEMIAKGDCEGFHVLENKFCYPITGVAWERLFTERHAEEVMETFRESLVVHFWNNLSKKTPLPINSTAPYVQLAKQFCPKVFATCEEFF